MKKNGFMVVECIIASVVVLTVIIVLFVHVKSVSRAYEKSYSYDNVSSMYALSNFRKFLMEGNNYDRLLQNYKNNKSSNSSQCGKQYVFVSCSVFSGSSVNYCDLLLDTMGLKASGTKPRQIIFTNSNLDDLKSCGLKQDYGSLSSTLVDYILSMGVTEGKDKYMLIAEFNDKTLAAIQVYRSSEV